jgi:hypothetical protein
MVQLTGGEEMTFGSLVGKYLTYRAAGDFAPRAYPVNVSDPLDFRRNGLPGGVVMPRS